MVIVTLWRDMSYFQHKISGVAIVFGLLFCIVTTARAESVEITNTVYSYSNSGGHGQDGAPGEDGAPGQDGRSGSDGQSVINGTGSASVRIETMINGEENVRIVSVNSDSATSTGVKISTSTPTGDLSVEERSRLIALLERIRLILMNYVFNILQGQ